MWLNCRSLDSAGNMTPGHSKNSRLPKAQSRLWTRLCEPFVSARTFYVCGLFAEHVNGKQDDWQDEHKNEPQGQITDYSTREELRKHVYQSNTQLRDI
ncbi:hypothetical protein BpHYR1_010862 [Brachionus plicatilis]|uniref:Uncharacterized protein n=1 Tax=Brachionus plicatilis TaxID=10195 RepID=A0A3M7RV61_BRAPC|nr:hypothetical protein BpHYR1_010862 [Brachionus plicatilis]